MKRGGFREEFSRDKLMNSMLVACRKRRIPIEDLKVAFERIERDLHQRFEDEVVSQEIGERVLVELLKIDSVAYVRFASVYRQFETLSDFAEMVESVECGAEGLGASR